ncbi:DedA family protein [Actinomadura sp. 3N407]|uniref:DedA family protein n=1 Tax=Actinomadura sp. 3N407 TaxID=3457423 RepID=UPI003FCE7B32
MIEMTYRAASGEVPTGGIAGWATDLMDKLGAPGAGLAIALENLFPPLPSEVILPLAGFAAAQGRMSLTAALVWTTVGSVAGALVLYGIGALIGRDRIRALVARLPLVKLDDLDRTEAWFARHGGKAVFFGRMIPIFRSLISVPAGLERMRVTTFLLYTTLGSLLWNTAFVLAGYGLGDNWRTVEKYAGMYSKAVLALIALAGVAFAAVRIVKARRAAKGRRAGRERQAGAHRPGTHRPEPHRPEPHRPGTHQAGTREFERDRIY